MTAETSNGAQTFRLMYQSESLIPQENRRADLGDLFSEARSKNKAKNITGALLISENTFVQVLEGDEDVVRALYAKIEQDPRHHSVRTLDTKLVPGKVFSRWAMAKVADEGEPDIPLIAHTKGIAPAAGRGTTPEQDELLDVMRSAARGDSESAAH